MIDAIRTADARFEALDWPFAPRYLTHDDGLRQHYVDERPDGEPIGTCLLLHGEPSWAYLYRDWIAPLLNAGYRVVAPDHIGFGRSDKPTDDGWYTIAAHRRKLRDLIEHLDLGSITLVVQDWAGPIGLCTAVEDQGRYERLVILNTWLHDDDFEYSEGVRFWRQAALDPTAFGGDMPTGAIVASTIRRPGHDLEAITAAFDAPYESSEAKAGARRFPFLIPFAEPELGDAVVQAAAKRALRSWNIPISIAFGDADPVFEFVGAERWAAELPTSTLHKIEQAGHFVQIDAPEDCLSILLGSS